MHKTFPPDIEELSEQMRVTCKGNPASARLAIVTVQARSRLRTFVRFIVWEAAGLLLDDRAADEVIELWLQPRKETNEN